VDRLPGPRLTTQMPFCEFAPRMPLPRIPTLTRWFHKRKHDIRVGFVAPRQSFWCERGAMRLDALPPENVKWLSDAAKTLEAAYVLLPTGRDIALGQRDRNRLAEYCTALGESSGRPVVWAPGGLWEHDAAAAQADRMGVGLSVDALEDPFHGTERAYGRLMAVGARARLGEGHLGLAIEAAAQAEAGEIYLSLEDEPVLTRTARLTRVAAEWAEADPSLTLAEVSPLDP
jgi:hypothetical protein